MRQTIPVAITSIAKKSIFNWERIIKKKIFAVATIAVTLFSSQAFAQAQHFEGFSVFGGINIANSTVDSVLWQQAPQSKGLVFESYQGQSTKANVGIEGQYAFALGEGFVLAAGANIGLGELAFGDPGYGLPGSITLKRTTALFVKPGYAVSDSTLVFAKLASLQGTAAWRSSDDRLSGRGVGLGVQMRSGKNVFYQVEWNQNRYDDVVLQNGVERLGSNLWTLGVGYKF